MNRILSSRIRTNFGSPTGPQTEPGPDKASLLEWLFTNLAAGELLPLRKTKASAHCTQSQKPGQALGHVLALKQVQETGMSPPPVLESEDRPFLMRSLLPRGSRK